MTDTEERLLTGNDRCDACRAQAYYIVELKSGELLFCRHHFAKNEDTLINIAIEIYDESDVLTEPKRPTFEED